MIREAINELKKYTRGRKNNEKVEVSVLNLNRIIFALEEPEPILDKIRAEIKKAIWEDVIISLDGTDEIRLPCLNPDDVFDILDKYKIGCEDR